MTDYRKLEPDPFALDNFRAEGAAPETPATGGQATRAPPRRFLRMRAVQEITGLPPSTVYQLMNEGRFPKSIPLGGGKMRGWLEEEIETWMDGCLAERDSA